MKHLRKFNEGLISTKEEILENFLIDYGFEIIRPEIDFKNDFKKSLRVFP